MDPIELRRINDTPKEPIEGKPYTSRSLMACYDEAAKAFGWASRNSQPKSMSEGDWLIGYGCATTCYPTQMAPAAARVRLQRDGRVRIEIAGHEIGNGAYTVIGQAAAERLGVPFDKVSVFIGDSDLPPAPVAGGSNSTASTCSAVITVCDQIRRRLFKALAPEESVIDKAKETGGMGKHRARRLLIAIAGSTLIVPSTHSVSAWSRSMASGSPKAHRGMPSRRCTRVRWAWSGATR
jgi:xanthine dehydrogenase YagR molybdenum-binding subunit